MHRSELLRFVHRPQLLKVTYSRNTRSGDMDADISDDKSFSKLFQALKQANDGYNFLTDPYIAELMRRRDRGDKRSEEILQKTLMKGDTCCKKTLEKLQDKATAMLEELGASPTAWYLNECISRYLQSMRFSDTQTLDYSSKEKRHLHNILKRLPISQYEENLPMALDHLSPKVHALVDLLQSESSESFTGLIFVEQRVWVATLAKLLSIHPQTRHLFKIGTFVGTSQSTKRKGTIADLAEPRSQMQSLEDFRSGDKNLILATTVDRKSVV